MIVCTIKLFCYSEPLLIYAYKQNEKASSTYSKINWEGKYHTFAQLGMSSQKDYILWQLQRVHAEVLGSGYYSSQCKTQEHRTSKKFSDY